MTNSFHVPILFIIFNRPDTTLDVFNNIRSMQPTQLFVAADGPRDNVVADVEKCSRARKIATAVDWDCEVHTLFRDRNLGCGLGPSSAITWFFEHVEEGIILEDDCLPDKSFYLFCETLLDYYRNMLQVMHISGDNFQYGRKRANGSYYFSRYTHSWGWATWRRAWSHYDFYSMPEEYREHSWDYQWELSVAKQQGLTVLPNINLVKNIGFGPDATHTKKSAIYSNLLAHEIKFPLIHPKTIRINRKADTFTHYVHFLDVKYPRLIWWYSLRDSLKFVWHDAKKYFWGGVRVLKKRF